MTTESAFFYAGGLSGCDGTTLFDFLVGEFVTNYFNIFKSISFFGGELASFCSASFLGAIALFFSVSLFGSEMFFVSVSFFGCVFVVFYSISFLGSAFEFFN